MCCMQISQGCAEIRWLATRMGAQPKTVAGLSGFADIMLTCYGALSRNRQVGIRLGKGESIQDILQSSTQVAEGVATAGSVVRLARRYRVSLPVLTAVASVLVGDCDIEEAVRAVINLPQLEEN
jgi:glycerol-3-phosphate dehydrogenase (NAD+)